MTNTKLTSVLGVVAVSAVATALLAAGPADAASPVKTNCSSFKQAASTKYSVRVCAELQTAKGGDRQVKESVTVKNAGKADDSATGFAGVSWGQAGTGESIAFGTVSPGNSKTVTRYFKNVGKGPYIATAGITVDKHSATVRSRFSK